MNYELTKIVIIGSGNLAEALARAVAGSGLCLVQVHARNAARAQEVAAMAGTAWATEAERLAEADLYLIAVSDRAVAEVAATLPIPSGAAVAHTAGSVPLEALPAKFGRRAVFYPLQTFTRGRAVDFSQIPIFLECDERRNEEGMCAAEACRPEKPTGGNDAPKQPGNACGGKADSGNGERPGAEDHGRTARDASAGTTAANGGRTPSQGDFRCELETFARRLSHTVLWADSARRAQLHLAGVFACNFVNHLYALGERIARDAELNFDVLKPLVRETAAKALDAPSPVRVQTGPAVRGDRTTQERHKGMLAADPLLEAIYETLSQSIWEISRKI